MTSEEYHAKRARFDMTHAELKKAHVTKSVLADFAPSPWKWRNGGGKKVTPAMVDGLLFDCLLTQPGEFSKLFAHSEFDSFRTKAAQEWKADVQASGKHVVTGEEIVAAEASIASLKTDFHWLGNGEFQVPLFGEADFDGVTLTIAGLVDFMPAEDTEYGDAIVDVKRTDSVSYCEFSKVAASKKYHVQAGMYLMLARLMGLKRERFIFVVQEREAPHESALFELSQADVNAGQLWAETQIARFAKCVKTDTWPKANEGLVTLTLPAWVRKEDE